MLIRNCGLGGNLFPYAVPVPGNLMEHARDWLRTAGGADARLTGDTARFRDPALADEFADMLGLAIDALAA